MRGVPIAAAVVCVLALFPAITEAELFSGTSEQGKLARVWTHPNGKVREFSIRWRTNDCDNGNVEATQTGIIPRHETAKRFHADRSYDLTQSDGAHVKFTASVRGALVSPDLWEGRFKVKVHAEFPGGATVECHPDPIRWSAKR